jgi:hypothetical protein
MHIKTVILGAELREAPTLGNAAYLALR